MPLRIGQILYCIDENSPFYGKKVKIDLFIKNGEPLFSDYETDRPIDVRLSQLDDSPPRKRGIRKKKT